MIAAMEPWRLEWRRNFSRIQGWASASNFDQASKAMTDTPRAEGKVAPTTQNALDVLAEQRRDWEQGKRLLVEAYLEQQPELRADAERILDLIHNEMVLRREAGESLQAEEYRSRFPELAPQVGRLFEAKGLLDSGHLYDTITHTPVVEPTAPAQSTPAPAVAGYECWASWAAAAWASSTRPGRSASTASSPSR